MSQAKVDQKKELKKNRQKLVKQAKIKKIVAIAVTSVICAAIAVWIGFSIYNAVSSYIEANAPMEYNDVNINALEDYLDSLNK